MVKVKIGVFTYPQDRYNVWAGNPQGRPYDPECCAESVLNWNHLLYQCQKKPGHGPHGLFCKQHAKILEAKR